jgi:hypothetical protein
LSFKASLLSLHASIVSVNGPPWFNFETQQLMNFECDRDLDPAHFYEDPNPASQNNADQDPHFPAIFHAQNSRKLSVLAHQQPEFFHI